MENREDIIKSMHRTRITRRQLLLGLVAGAASLAAAARSSSAAPTPTATTAKPAASGAATSAPAAAAPAAARLVMSAEINPAQLSLDFDVPNGHFFTQTNGRTLGTTTSGYYITNDQGIVFWNDFQEQGNWPVLGYPVTNRFIYKGFVTQAFQKLVFQWRPDTLTVDYLNTFDELSAAGKDDFLLAYRQIPKPFSTSPDAGLPYAQVVARHLAFLDQNTAIRDFYFSSTPDPIDQYGLPVSYGDFGNVFVVRAQRAAFQYWKVNVPWASAGQVTVVNGGDLAKEVGLWPTYATNTSSTPTQFISGPLRTRNPDYGMEIFIYGYPTTTARDLGKVVDADFNWQKSYIQWSSIEGAGKGQFDWSQADSAIKAATDAGMLNLVRTGTAPAWSRADHQTGGPPDNPADFADYVTALVHRYGYGSPIGRIHAIEMWNEPNLARELAGQTPNAAQYVQLLKAGYLAAKAAAPNITVLTAGLSPTGTYNSTATPDMVYLQQMYDAGVKGFFDVYSIHAAGYKASPETSPAEAAANPALGGNAVFCFRHAEQLQQILVQNGDGDKQVWITEFGWTSDPIHPAYSWFAVSEQTKADYLVRAFLWAHNNWPWCGAMMVWTLPSPEWTPADEQYWWAIAKPDGTNRPAYIELSQARHSGQLP